MSLDISTDINRLDSAISANRTPSEASVWNPIRLCDAVFSRGTAKIGGAVEREKNFCPSFLVSDEILPVGFISFARICQREYEN